MSHGKSKSNIILADYLSKKVLVLLYATCMLLSFGLSYWRLNNLQEQQNAVFKHAIFFYSQRDPEMYGAAYLAKGRLGMSIMDVESPEAGKLVRQLTGAHQIIVPTVVIPLDDSVSMYSPIQRTVGSVSLVQGTDAMQGFLEPILNNNRPLLLAKTALFVMAVLVLMVWVFQTEVLAVASLLSIPALLAISMMNGHCLSCGVHYAKIAILAPMLGLVYVLASIALYMSPRFMNLPLARFRFCHLSFMVVSAAVPVFQSCLLIVEPKLCPACLTITFISAAYFLTSLTTVVSKQLPGVVVPRFMPALVLMCWALLTVRQGLVLQGRIAIAAEKPEVAPRIIGTSINEFVPRSMGIRPGILLVLTMQGCHSCEILKQRLPQTGLAWQEIPLCHNTDQACFNPGHQSFATPLLLICNQQGRIIYQHEGWVSSALAESKIVEQIHATQQGVMSAMLKKKYPFLP